jgi:hypothetical protein
MMRIITFPGSLNGEIGLICPCLGEPRDFERTDGSEIVRKSDVSRFFYDMNDLRASNLFNQQFKEVCENASE